MGGGQAAHAQRDVRPHARPETATLRVAIHARCCSAAAAAAHLGHLGSHARELRGQLPSSCARVALHLYQRLCKQLLLHLGGLDLLCATRSGAANG